VLQMLYPAAPPRLGIRPPVPPPPAAPDAIPGLCSAVREEEEAEEVRGVCWASPAVKLLRPLEGLGDWEAVGPYPAAADASCTPLPNRPPTLGIGGDAVLRRPGAAA
jgi:hypothetical protein